MRHTTFWKKTFVTLSTLAAVVALAFAGLLAWPSTAYAAPPAQTPEPPRFEGRRLEYALQRHKLHLQNQQLRIDFAHEAADQAQRWIDFLKGQGKDTSALEAALAEYERQLDAAQASWDRANSILTTAAGFDSNGQVTDPVQARETLMDANDAMIQTHRILVDAARAFHRAVFNYRTANAGNA
jgi:hypothetical protein